MRPGARDRVSLRRGVEVEAGEGHRVKERRCSFSLLPSHPTPPRANSVAYWQKLPLRFVGFFPRRGRWCQLCNRQSVPGDPRAQR